MVPIGSMIDGLSIITILIMLATGTWQGKGYGWDDLDRLDAEKKAAEKLILLKQKEQIQKELDYDTYLIEKYKYEKDKQLGPIRLPWSRATNTYQETDSTKVLTFPNNNPQPEQQTYHTNRMDSYQNQTTIQSKYSQWLTPQELFGHNNNPYATHQRTGLFNHISIQLKCYKIFKMKLSMQIIY